MPLRINFFFLTFKTIPKFTSQKYYPFGMLVDRPKVLSWKTIYNMIDFLWRICLLIFGSPSARGNVSRTRALHVTSRQYKLNSNTMSIYIIMIGTIAWLSVSCWRTMLKLDHMITGPTRSFGLLIYNKRTYLFIFLWWGRGEHLVNDRQKTMEKSISCMIYKLRFSTIFFLWGSVKSILNSLYTKVCYVKFRFRSNVRYIIYFFSYSQYNHGDQYFSCYLEGVNWKNKRLNYVRRTRSIVRSRTKHKNKFKKYLDSA